MLATVLFMAANGPAGLSLGLLGAWPSGGGGGRATRSERTMRDGVRGLAVRVAYVLCAAHVDVGGPPWPALADVVTERQKRQTDSRAVFHMVAGNGGNRRRRSARPVSHTVDDKK